MTAKPLTTKQLKAVAGKVVVAQGNSFIKELLRNNGAKIGSTKDDFTANLNAAIESGLITQDKLEGWLIEVEGWGDQHVYLLKPPAVDVMTLQTGIAASPHAATLGASASLDFPDALGLKHIANDAASLSMTWHQRKESWNRWRPKDFVQEEGLERYRFDAYRERFDRSIVRFDWRFDNPYCAILIHRNTEIDHEAVFAEVRRALKAIGCPDEPLARIRLSEAVKSAAMKAKGVHTTRFELDEGYVEMGSLLAEGGIEMVEPVRLALHAVDTSQFDRAQGMLHFAAEEHGVSRRIAVQVYGSEARLRIWAQCKREDVSQILQLLWDYNKGG
jgi:hypothetical protein